MPRRSERLNKTKAEQPVYIIESDDDATPDPPPKKVRKTIGSKPDAGSTKSKWTRGKRGKLEQMTEMPLDILFEIFAQLAPYDLLNLSRTSKALRNILMHRSSTYVWKSARSHIVGLPECPSDLSEPQYANLIYYPYCHFCLKTQVPSQAINWTTRSRCCKKCILENFVTAPEPYEVPLSIVPSIDLPGKRCTLPAYCLRTLRRYRTEIQGLESTALDEWYLARRSEYEARLKHASRCEAWNRSRTEERSNELENIRQRRYEAIKERLSLLGWGEEIARLERDDWRLEQLSDHKLVKQPKDLTDRIWRNIMQPLVDFMERTKARHLVLDRTDAIRKRGHVLSQILNDYAASQPLHAILPPVADIAILPSFRTIVENTPYKDKVLKSHFEQAMNELPSIVSTWRKSKDEELTAMIRGGSETGTEVTEATLLLAATFFRCSYCAREISYPRILVHACTTRIGFYDVEKVDPYFDDLTSRPWNDGHVVSFDPLASRRARLILRSCGLSPETLTSDQLNTLDLRFECRKCTEPEKGRLIMRWPRVISHMARHKELPEEDLTDLIQLPDFRDDEALLCDMLEDARMSPLSGHPAHRYSWICIGCKRRIPWHGSLDHLKEQHSDAIPDEYTEEEYIHHFDRYFALHLDATGTSLFEPLRVDVTNPAQSFREAFSSFHMLSGNTNGYLDSISQQLAQVFFAGQKSIG
ncbi:hypothetical protein LshimejAT787_0210460 [Lyophyllum shimeji]|uniref:F-box domain-containing protein n=1 Tax=Lyophyllum shimeji TaxID=47721 RepID=A0A9P3PGM5_LYOSH|nr:hypothetical protein LshimejAT787_0210460 [Lyophyllum shimeji]